MKKVLWAALVVVLAISAFVFTGCGEHEGSDAFSVIFVIDGQVVEAQTVKSGENFNDPSR